MHLQVYFRNGLYEYVDLWDGASHTEDQATVKDLGAIMWGALTDELPGDFAPAMEA
jgi:hypothetical protein